MHIREALRGQANQVIWWAQRVHHELQRSSFTDDRVKDEAKKFVEGIKEKFAPISVVVEKMRKGEASIKDFLNGSKKPHLFLRNTG